jgi:hypothetical protein
VQVDGRIARARRCDSPLIYRSITTWFSRVTEIQVADAGLEPADPLGGRAVVRKHGVHSLSVGVERGVRGSLCVCTANPGSSNFGPAAMRESMSYCAVQSYPHVRAINT